MRPFSLHDQSAIGKFHFHLRAIVNAIFFSLEEVIKPGLKFTRDLMVPGGSVPASVKKDPPGSNTLKTFPKLNGVFLFYVPVILTVNNEGGSFDIFNFRKIISGLPE